MAISVAKTYFETEPNKELIVVDVYGETPGSEPVNGEASVPSAPGATIDSILPKTVTELLDKTFKDPNKSLKEAMAEIGAIVKNPREFSEKLGKEILGDTLKSIGYTGTVDDAVKAIRAPVNLKAIMTGMGESNAQLKVIIDGVEKAIDGKDLSTANGVAALIAGLTGDDNLMSVMDVGPQMSVVKGFIDKAMELRLPEAVDLLIETFDKEDEKNKLKLYSTQNAALNGDIDFINKQIDNNDIGPGAIMALNPDLIYTTLMNYSLNGESPTVEHATKLLEILNKLDKNWMSYERDGVRIEDLSAVANASHDALRVLMKNESTMTAAIIASGLDDSDLVTATLNMRPFTPPEVLTA